MRLDMILKQFILDTIGLLPNIHASLYVFLSAKTVFTLSHDELFCLILRNFRCEGLDLQVFTAQRLFTAMTFPDFSAVFLREGLPFPPFTSVHRSCECLKNKTFTPGTYEIQQETRFVWRGEYFFQEIINVYTRARTAYSLSSLLLFSAWLIRFACPAGYYVKSSSQLADYSAGLLD